METGETSARLNSAQALHLLTTARYADKLFADIEGVLVAAKARSPFRDYKNPLPPGQIKIIEDYLASIRAQLAGVLESQGIALPEPAIDSIHAIRTTLNFVKIAFEDCRPKRMRGYGEVPQSYVRTLNGLVDEMIGAVEKLDTYLAQALDLDLGSRLERLQRNGRDIALAKTLERIINQHGLVEFRSMLSMIVERLESPHFEIALFGRVNSGKSSLLNAILQAEVLPVGVNPITSVPTRVVYGPNGRLTVWYADRKPDRLPVERLADFVTEERNPANSKHVARIVVELNSPRLREGIAFVDTPGLGSLATHGAKETMAYLPRCDLGVVLIDAASTLAEDDLATIRLLYEAGAEASVLLSKSDLVDEDDRKRQLAYVSRQISTRLGIDLSAHPVSVRADQGELLERWLKEEIFPRYRSHRQSAQASIERKIGVLREAVAAALHTRLQRAAKKSPSSDIDPAAIEAHLRSAVGLFAEAREACSEVAQEIEGFADQALTAAASHLIHQWRADAGAPATPAIRHTIAAIATARASLITGLLANLTRELTVALGDTARDLGFTDGHDEADLKSVFREMPRFDSGSWDVRLAPSCRMKLSARLEARRVEQSLRKQIGETVSTAFYNFSKMLDAWARRALNELQLRFDAQADRYRAHLHRLTESRALSEAEEISLRRDLDQLTRAAEFASVR